MGQRDRGERTGGVAFQAFVATDPKGKCDILFAAELDRLYIRARKQVQGQARRGRSCIQGKDPTAPPQPERSLCVLGQSMTSQRARGLGSYDGRKAFSIEKGWSGRGNSPDPVAVVLIAEPNRISRQALG